jgi:hypothetical protein
MDLTALFDPGVWDNFETANYQSVRTTAASGGTRSLPEIQAKRRAPTFKELAASGGVYTGQDLVWLVPAVKLDPIGPAKPGDTITDMAGNTWTVLEASLHTWKSFWRLMTRNLVLAFDLRDQISIQRAAFTYDASGGPVRSWPDNNVPGVAPGGTTPYVQIPARVQEVRQEEKEARALAGRMLYYDVIIGQQVLLGQAGQDRVKWLTVPANMPGQYLDIRNLRNPQRIDELPVLECHLAL